MGNQCLTDAGSITRAKDPVAATPIVADDIHADMNCVLANMAMAIRVRSAAGLAPMLCASVTSHLSSVVPYPDSDSSPSRPWQGILTRGLDEGDQLESPC